MSYWKISPSRSPTRVARNGQSLVEFALVLPIMLMLFLGIGDLGRVFSTGVVAEAAARDAAEVAANMYLSDPPGTAGLDAAVVGATADEYRVIHQAAAEAVCQEVRPLPNTQGSGANCAGMPLIKVCVHDSVDPLCDSEVFGAVVPPDCPGLNGASSNSQAGGGGQRWVEVRICYQFTPLLDVPLISFDAIWIERGRSFVIPCYFVLGTGGCG